MPHQLEVEVEGKLQVKSADEGGVTTVEIKIVSIEMSPVNDVPRIPIQRTEVVPAGIVKEV
jgi:hypothetical protein